jgi:hypothetical protein
MTIYFKIHILAIVLEKLATKGLWSNTPMSLFPPNKPKKACHIYKLWSVITSNIMEILPSLSWKVPCPCKMTILPLIVHTIQWQCKHTRDPIYLFEGEQSVYQLKLNWVTYLNKTPTFVWWMFRFRSKNVKDVCLTMIWIMWSKSLIIHS